MVLLDVQGEPRPDRMERHPTNDSAPTERQESDLNCALSDEVEWDAQLAADVLSAVMQALAELPIEPIAFQQAIMKAAMGVGNE